MVVKEDTEGRDADCVTGWVPPKEAGAGGGRAGTKDVDTKAPPRLSFPAVLHPHGQASPGPQPSRITDRHSFMAFMTIMVDRSNAQPAESVSTLVNNAG